MTRRIALSSILFLLLLVTPVQADYLEVRRASTIKAQASASAEILSHPSVGTYLPLLDDQQVNGYYKVRDPVSGNPGWIYRTFVRRYTGNPPTGGSGAKATQDFPSCPLPFESIKESHPIDNTCGADGKTQSEANREQNLAKNNFCATGDPVQLSLQTFAELQQTAEDQNISFGSAQNLPADRSVLKGLYKTSDGKKIGEGSVVRLVAYVVHAHYSNVSSGESVNCKLHGKENNDIHIMLGQSTDTTDCDTVTAEMSPHFRPAAWDQLPDLNLKFPVRITGQLFFDASHRPCKNGRGPNPKRISIWEIHPVYALDVCSNATLAACKATDESAWTPLDQWLSTGEGVSRATSP